VKAGFSLISINESTLPDIINLPWNPANQSITGQIPSFKMSLAWCGHDLEALKFKNQPS
jgi:hypothetical protein